MAQSASEQTQNFLSRLSGVRQTGNGWQARCPCREDDNNPSLAIGQGDDGRTLVTCHRAMSCDVEKICSSVGLKVSDLMPPDGKFTPSKNSSSPTKTQPTKQQPSAPVATSKPKFVKAYDYTDEHGVLLFQKTRLVDEDGKKTFRQRKPDGQGGWIYSLGDTPKVLYNLPAVLDAKSKGIPIWLVEGEKDADTLMEMGIVATTMPGGAGKWLDIHTEALAGGVIEIVADNDDIGKKHAIDVFNELQSVGCDSQLWICPSTKDITDHIDSGAKIEDLVPFEVGADVLQEIEIEQPEERDTEELSAEELTLLKLNELLNRDDLTAKQKIAKSNLIVASSTIGHVLDTGRLVQWNDFLAESTNETHEWVIPGLVERMERVIVVAAEGVGKTMLARQIAICCSAGIHPFSFQRMPQVRTLTVDLENPERIIRRTSRQIASEAMSLSKVEKLEAYILTKPSGMDLLKAQDRSILEEAIEEVQPQILVIGPLYKAFLDPGGRTSESVALEIAKYLDAIRTVYNCSLWIEHHAPLGSTMSTRDLRPFGSAVWSRWPEFGISLQPDPTALGDYVYDVKHFRGAREERPWPLKMKRGKRFPFEVIDWMKVGP